MGIKRGFEQTNVWKVQPTSSYGAAHQDPFHDREIEAQGGGLSSVYTHPPLDPSRWTRHPCPPSQALLRASPPPQDNGHDEMQSPALFLDRELRVGAGEEVKAAPSDCCPGPPASLSPGLPGWGQTHSHMFANTLWGSSGKDQTLPTSLPQLTPLPLSHTDLLIVRLEDHMSPTPGPWHMLLSCLNIHPSPPSSWPHD